MWWWWDKKVPFGNKKDKYGNIIYSYRCSRCKRDFYKEVRKTTYWSKKYNKLLEYSVLQLIDNMYIEELENKVKEKYKCYTIHGSSVFIRVRVIITIINKNSMRYSYAKFINRFTKFLSK